MSKLQESVERVLSGQLDLDGHRQTVDQVLQIVDGVRDSLDRVRFPSHYDAGPVLLEYARTGLERVEAGVNELAELQGPGDDDWAHTQLDEVHQAFSRVREILQEIQSEQGK